MKQIKKLMSFVLTLAMVLATVVVAKPVEAGGSNSHGSYWTYTTQTNYTWANGKWKKTWVSKNKYDKKGRITEDINTSYWDGKKNTSKTVYKYDSKGRQTESIYYSEGKKSGSTKYSYDGKGRQNKYMSYDAAGKLTSTTTIQFDKKGYECKSTTKYTDKSRKTEVTTTTRTYNKSGWVTKNVHKSPWGKSTTTYEYYKNGDRKKEVYKSSYSTTTYEYASGWRLKKTTTKNKDGSKTVRVPSYNKKGATIKEVETYTPKNGEKTVNTYTYSYKYDKKGNQTQSITKRNGENQSKTVSSGWTKITY
ncbi:MAG: hypothetical protein IKQ71_07600 [Lachnospiraceae bacterium]|nr:hypothetical protein [Lachnospiraceae bacterium]